MVSGWGRVLRWQFVVVARLRRRVFLRSAVERVLLCSSSVQIGILPTSTHGRTPMKYLALIYSDERDNAAQS